jgi:hypothetical protein
MTSKRIFYRNVIPIEILSEEPLSGNESLSDFQVIENTREQRSREPGSGMFS